MVFVETVPSGNVLELRFWFGVDPGDIDNYAFFSKQINPVTSALLWTLVDTIGFFQSFEINNIRMKIIGIADSGNLVRVVGTYQDFVVCSSDYTNCQGLLFPFGWRALYRQGSPISN